MNRQSRVTALCSVFFVVLLAGALFAVRGNQPVDDVLLAGESSESEVIDPEVIETSADDATTTTSPDPAPPVSAPSVSTTGPIVGDETPTDSDTESGGFVLDFPDDVEFPATDTDAETATDTDATSTSSSTSTSTSTTTSTTTTIAPPQVDDGFEQQVLLQEGWAAFGTANAEPALLQVGDDGARALAAAITTLGDPTGDTGLLEDDDCSALRVRRVRFGGLELVLAERIEDVITFQQWYVDGDLPGGVPLEIEDGLTPGLSVEDLLAIDVLMVVFGDDDGSGGSFKMPGDTSNSPVWGLTTGTAPGDTVTAVWSGTECRRL